MGGLPGIVLCPFLHVSLTHLIANSVALFVLLSLALTIGRVLTICALVLILLFGGGLVWLFGRAGTVHVGASGLIFGLIGFLAASGLFRLEWRALAYSILALYR
jgi:membrane associated rhomboid family serine protease